MILFLKATIKGGAAGNLFDEVVQIKGHVTKQGTFVAPHTGIRHKAAEDHGDLFSVMAPAQAKPVQETPAPKAEPDAARKVRLYHARKDADPKGSEFGADEVADARKRGWMTKEEWDARQTRDDRTQRQIRLDTRAAEAEAPKPSGPLLAGLPDDAELIERSGKWIVRAGDKETQPADTQEAAAASARAMLAEEKAETPAEESAASVAPEPVSQWGVPAGITKQARRRLNAEAVALLHAKSDADMTPADRAVLAQYSGTGGVGDSLNEFYTDPDVARAMWSMLANAGFTGGDVLEPSSGTGVFLHTAPAGARVVAVEMDPTSSRIAGILHRPFGHEVQNASLERFATQDGRLFDAVIGNVPFGLRGATIRDDKRDIATAERYFYDTALDKTKDGGLVALIVPTGVMDSSNGASFRADMLAKGEFLGAMRLPNTAFEAGHTAVTSDIILFRKRPQEAAGALGTLTADQVSALGVNDPEFVNGSYFTGSRGSANIMGRMEDGWRAKAGMGQDITVTGSMQGVPAALAQWRPEPANPTPDMATILGSLQDDPQAQRRAVSAALKPAYQVAKLGDQRVIDGVRYVLQGEPPRWHKAEDELPDAVSDARVIADLLDDLVEGRAKDPRYTRAALAEALDAYVREHGIPGRNKDLKRWLGNPSMPNHDGAEPVDHAARVADQHRRTARLLGAVGDDGGYSDMVTGATRAQGVATLDTVATKLSLESGGFQVEQAAEQIGADRAEVLDQLFASPLYAIDPDGKTWTTIDAYLSGDMWTKLDAVKAAIDHEGLAPEYRAKYVAQAEALEKAIDPQSLEDVEIMLNSGFVDPADITAWFASKRDAWVEENPHSQYPGPTAYVVTYSDGLYEVTGGKHGVYGDAALIERFLNRTGVRKTDRDTLARINQEFRDWVLSSDRRDAMEDRYNRSYRGYAPKVYADTQIAIPGLNSALDVNAYHFAGLRWALEAGKGIIAADVGLGKTGRGLMLAKLAKVTGQAKKPTFVVPKSVLANWMAEAEFWFPGSKCLVIGETYATDKAGRVVSKPDNEETRRRKYHDLQQNDYDFVFISQPAWNDLDVDPETKKNYSDEDFWTKRGTALGLEGDKKLNKIRTAHEQEIAGRDFEKREGTVYFNELGIDMLILDEGHAFKNLYAAKNRFGEAPKFLGGSGKSNRALDTFYKTKSLRNATGGRGVFMLTATPTKNSPLEVYSMLSHIAPEAFDRMGIKNSEDFLDRFCEFRSDTVLTTSGEIEEALITSGFKNLDELREVMRRYIDRKTADDVGLVIPRADHKQHMVDMTPEQEAVYVELREAAAAKDADAEGGHIFSIMAKMGKASLDLGLLGMKSMRSPKVDACIEQVKQNIGDGGQIVFCDHIDMHEKVAQAMVRAGIPREQIGIINAQAASSSAARQKITDDFNSGKLKVVIGNTATMGEGVNLQKGTADIHHLDLAWEPASMQQRNGRGVRQGNKKEAVRVHTYLAKGSFDGYRYQTILAKKDWQDLLWNGGNRVENLSREGAMSRADMLIMLSANPEEAREKYNSDKAAALARHVAERSGQAVEQFTKMQEMKRSHAAMAERGSESAAFRRLGNKIEITKEALRGNKYFSHQDVLDSDVPVVIEPVTDTAWRAGSSFNLAAGSGGPLHYSQHETRWVVTGVDMESGEVRARPYGTAAQHPITLKVADMKAGVAQVPYSHDEETEALKVEAAALEQGKRDQRIQAFHEKPGLRTMRSLPEDVVAGKEHEYQRRIKEAVQGFTDGWQDHYQMIDRDGNPVLAPSFKARHMLDDHDLILPTKEGRAQAIEGYVRSALGRKIDTYHIRSRNGSSSPAGVTAAYAGFEYGSDANGVNPWDRPLKSLFGDGALAEAKELLQQRVLQNVAGAKDLYAAVAAAQPSLKLGWSGPGALRQDSWSPEVVRALRAKAESLGVMDQPLGVVASASQRAYKPAVHHELYKVGGTDYGYTDGERIPGKTVRQFLAALPGGADSKEGAGDV